MRSFLKSHLKDQDLGLIAIILGLAFLIRIAYLIDYLPNEISRILPYTDAEFYYNWARDIASGDILGGRNAFMKWPFYGYFLAFFFRLCGASPYLAYSLQVILGALNCALIYVIAKVLFNRVVAFVAGLLYLGYGLSLFYEGLLIYTSLSLFLNSLLVLYFLYLKAHPAPRNIFYAGLLSGLCAITQANAILFTFLAVGWLFWEKGFAGRRLVQGAGVFLAGFGIVVGCVSLRNYIVEKDFVPIAGHLGINFYLGNNPQAQGTFSTPEQITGQQEAMFRESRIIARLKTGQDLKTSGVSAFWFRQALDFIRKNPLSYGRILAKKLLYILYPGEPVHDPEYYLLRGDIRVFNLVLMDLGLIWPLGLLGLFLGLKDFRQQALLYFALLSFVSGMLIFFVATRYRLAMVPFMAIFAASATTESWQSLRASRYRHFITVSLAAAILLYLSNVLFARRIRFSPDACRRFMDKAALYENKQEYGLALEELMRASSVCHRSQYFVFSLGAVYYGLNDFQKAEENFKQAILLSPFFVDAYYNLGYLYNRQGRFPEAISLLKKALLLDQKDSGLHFELGRAYAGNGEPGLARRQMQAALGLLSRWRKQDISLIEEELDKL